MTIRLPVRAPFHLEATVRVLQRRNSNLVDTWQLRRYCRVVNLGGNPTLLAVDDRGTLDAPNLRLTILRPDDVGAPPNSRERAEAARIASYILGLGVDTSVPQQRAEANPALRATALALRGLRPPRYPDLFETFANVIPFQQLSVEAGMAVVAKLVRRFGAAPTIGGARHFMFPRAELIAESRIARLEHCGMSRHKSHALRTVARAIAAGELTAAAIERLPSAEALEYLVALPGIGPWSAALVLLRGFGRIDVFPPADSGAEGSLIALMRLRSRASLARVVARFGEYRGFLYFYGLASRLLAAGLIQPAAA